MKRFLVKMTFTDFVHFGAAGIGLEGSDHRLHSDSLFSGLINAAALLFPKERVDSLLNDFVTGKAPFKLSSTFLYRGGTYYFPKPLALSPNLKSAGRFGREYGKQLKKLKFLPLHLFVKWQRNDIFQTPDLDSLVTVNREYETGYVSALLPRVVLDRSTAASEIYHCALVRFTENAGLYCLIELTDTAFENQLFAMFRMLGEQGVGGERTYGYGRFDVDFLTPDENFAPLFEPAPHASHFMTMSLVSPAENELPQVQQSLYAYDFTERRGWIFSSTTRENAKRQSLTMLAEGSIFSQPLPGHLRKVTPDHWQQHPIYRYGCAFHVPLFWE